MLLIHDIIKTIYTREGYLPDFPYHLVSDEEMIFAFIKDDVNFFDTQYPCPKGFESQYADLKSAILYHVDSYLVDIRSKADADIPDWVYSYMVGAVIGPESPEADRHDLFVLLGLDNIEDEFNSEIYLKIFRVSERWNYKLTAQDRLHRPPTIFGEPHVIKSLRLGEF